MGVTPGSVAVALGRLASSEAELAQWQFWIDGALIRIRSRHSDLSLLDPAVLDYVVTEAVVAQVRKPDDSTQVDIAIDDGSVSRRYASSTGQVTILDEWWLLLDPLHGSRDGFTITPGGVADLVAYAPVVPLAAPWQWAP